MKRVCITLLVCSLLCPTRAWAAEPAKAGTETELTRVMEGMGSAFRKIRRQGNDASKNAETLKLAAQLKSQALVALALVPELAAAKTGSEREALVKGYRREMQALVGEIDRLILALEKGNNAELPAILESIASRQKQGHRDYRMEKP